MELKISLFLHFLLLVSIHAVIGKRGEDPIVALIKTEAHKLPRESYESDPFVFIQHVDKKKRTTAYHFPKNKELGPAVFKSHTNDFGKTVVVLLPGEDRLKVTLLKKTYVVLIRDKKNRKRYRPLYAYARGGNVIEWDVWEPQRMKESKAFALGWDSCSSSIYTPCKPEFEGKLSKHPPGYTQDIWGRRKIDLHIASRTSKYDYFVDLEDSEIEKRQIGRTLKFLLNNTDGFNGRNIIREIDYKPHTSGAGATHPITSGTKGKGRSMSGAQAGRAARGKYDEEIDNYYRDLKAGKVQGNSGQPVTDDKWNAIGLPPGAGKPKPSQNNGGQGNSAWASSFGNNGNQAGMEARSISSGNGAKGNQSGRAMARGKYDEEIDNYYRDLKAGKVQGNSGQPVTDDKWNAIGLPPGAGKPKPGQNNGGQSNSAWASSFGNNGNQAGMEARSISSGNGTKANQSGRAMARGKYDEEIDNYYRDLKAGKVQGNSGQPVTDDKWNAIGLPPGAGKPKPGQNNGGQSNSAWASSFGNNGNQAGVEGRSIVSGNGTKMNQSGRAVARGKYDEEIDNYYRDLKAGKVQGNSGQPVTDDKWNAIGLPPGAGKPKPNQNNGGQSNSAWASSFGNNGNQAGAEGRSIVSGNGTKVNQSGRAVARGKYDEEIDNYYRDLKAGKVQGNSGQPVTDDKWNAIGLPPGAGKPKPGQGNGGQANSAWEQSFGNNGNQNQGRAIGQGTNATQSGRAAARGKYDEEIDNYYRDLKAGKVQGNSGQPVTDDKWNAIGLPPGAGKPKPGQGNGGGGSAWASSFGNNGDGAQAQGRALHKSNSSAADETAKSHKVLDEIEGKHDERESNSRHARGSTRPVVHRRTKPYRIPVKHYNGHTGHHHNHREHTHRLRHRRQDQDDDDDHDHFPTSSEEEVFNFFKTQTEKELGNIETTIETSWSKEYTGLPRSQNYGKNGRTYSGFEGTQWIAQWKTFSGLVTSTGLGPFEGIHHLHHIYNHGHQTPDQINNQGENDNRPETESASESDEQGTSENSESGERLNRGKYSDESDEKDVSSEEVDERLNKIATEKPRINSGVKFVKIAARRPVQKSVEKMAVKSAETSVKKSAKGSAEKSFEKSAERSAQKSVEKSVERSPETSGEESTERSAEKSVEESSENLAEKSVEESTERSGEKSIEESSERSAVKSAESSAEKSVEKSADRSGEKSVEKSTERSVEKSDSKSDERSEKASVEASPENSVEKSSEKSVEQPHKTSQQEKSKQESDENSREQGSKKSKPSSGESSGKIKEDSKSKEDSGKANLANKHEFSDESHERAMHNMKSKESRERSGEGSGSGSTENDSTEAKDKAEESREKYRKHSQESAEGQHKNSGGRSRSSENKHQQLPVVDVHLRFQSSKNPKTSGEEDGKMVEVVGEITVAQSSKEKTSESVEDQKSLQTTVNVLQQIIQPTKGRSIVPLIGVQKPAATNATAVQGRGMPGANAGNATHPAANASQAAQAGRALTKTSVPSSMSVREYGRSIHEITNFLVSNQNDLDLFGRPGWKTQDLKTKDSIKKYKADKEHDPFEGFGRCPHENVSLAKFGAANKKDIESIIRAYLIPLRAQCNKPLFDTLVRLFKNSVLATETLTENGTSHFFKILPTWKTLTKPKLTITEKQELNIAYEFFWFSRTFLWQLDEQKGKLFNTLKDEVKDTTKLIEPKKSPHVVFRLYTALFMFDQIFSSIPAHAISLTRSLILTMKTTLMKSLQDYDRLRSCKDCDKKQLEELTNDVISLIAFPEFISNLISSDSRERGAKALVTKFDAYLTDNAKDLKDVLEDYTGSY